MLEFNTALEKDVMVIELEGALDSHSAVDFRKWFNEKYADGYRAYAIDCLCLEYISSAGIAAIIDLQSYLAGQGGKMVLYQLSGETRQLLRFLKLDQKVHIVADYDEAIGALTGYKRVVPESDIVQPDEMRISGEQSTAEEQVPLAAPAEAAAPASAPLPPHAPGEMVVEEHFAQEKKGLHPVHSDTPAAPVEQEPEPVLDTPEEQVSPSEEKAASAPEVQELRLNTGARRLISCPNCKSVLRVAIAGDYLCPSCRFRFTYKGAADGT